jgi:hypothetical protein
MSLRLLNVYITMTRDLIIHGWKDKWWGTGDIAIWTRFEKSTSDRLLDHFWAWHSIKCLCLARCGNWCKKWGKEANLHRARGQSQKLFDETPAIPPCPRTTLVMFYDNFLNFAFTITDKDDSKTLEVDEISKFVVKFSRYVRILFFSN